MTKSRRVQAVMGWGVAALLGVLAAVLPGLLDLNERLGRTGFFTPEAYAVVVALLVMGMIVASVSKHDSMQRAAAVGLGPMLVSLWQMALQGPGNLWPIALFLALLFGLPPALLGAQIARVFRHFRT